MAGSKAPDGTLVIDVLLNLCNLRSNAGLAFLSAIQSDIMATKYSDLQRASYSPNTTKKRKSDRSRASQVKTIQKKQARKRPSSEELTSDGEYSIEVQFSGGLSFSQQAVFEHAARRWEEVIVGDLQTVQLPTGEVVEGLLIDASGVSIDGENGVLGRAGPQFVRNNGLPAKGIMEFDTADLLRMEQEGSLEDVILHEMGHVIGIGTVWSDLSLLVGCPHFGSPNPVFLGDLALEEFNVLLGESADSIPVANTGGPGTACGHWRENVFGNELMTGFLSGSVRPLSRMTIASLADMGYEVDMDAADPYELPTQRQMALMGIGAERHNAVCRMCGGGIRPIAPVAIPDEMHMD